MLSHASTPLPFSFDDQRWLDAPLHIDAVFLDLILPDGRGDELLSMLCRFVSACRIGVVTGLIESDHWIALLSRCRVVVPKPLKPRTIVRLADHLTSDATVRSCLHAFARHFRLSQRETEVVQLAAEGYPSKEIPHILGFSDGTMASYWQRVFKKTGCRCQRDIFVALLQFGLAIGYGSCPLR